MDLVNCFVNFRRFFSSFSHVILLVFHETGRKKDRLTLKESVPFWNPLPPKVIWGSPIVEMNLGV